MGRWEKAYICWKRGSVLCLALFSWMVASVLFYSEVDLRGCFSLQHLQRERPSAVSARTHTHKHTHKHNHIETSRHVDLWKLLCSSDETGAHGSSCYGPTAGANNLKSRMKEKEEEDVYIFWQAFGEAEVWHSFVHKNTFSLAGFTDDFRINVNPDCVWIPVLFVSRYWIRWRPYFLHIDELCSLGVRGIHFWTLYTVQKSAEKVPSGVHQLPLRCTLKGVC